MVPIWVDANQGRVLNPPAEVMKIGDSRSAEALQAAADALHVTEAKRYAPAGVTFCNIFAADWCQILKAPLPHVFDLSDGKGARELRANDIFDGLKGQKFPGWSVTGSVASSLAVRNLAAVGIPQVAVWKNPINGHPGHIVGVIKSRDDRVWVVGAGAHCSNGCPIEDQFGPYLKDVLFAAYAR